MNSLNISERKTKRVLHQRSKLHVKGQFLLDFGVKKVVKL